MRNYKKLLLCLDIWSHECLRFCRLTLKNITLTEKSQCKWPFFSVDTVKSWCGVYLTLTFVVFLIIVCVSSCEITQIWWRKNTRQYFQPLNVKTETLFKFVPPPVFPTSVFFSPTRCFPPSEFPPSVACFLWRANMAASPGAVWEASPCVESCPPAYTLAFRRACRSDAWVCTNLVFDLCNKLR